MALMPRSRRVDGAACVLLLFAAWQWGGWAVIHAKAALAPVLIARAWRDTLALPADDATAGVRPWPWADTWPVARLTVAARGIDLYVLAGANGASLPFGPGWLDGSAAVPGRGTMVIAGHRDTHFEFLSELRVGELVSVQGRSGRVARFRVTDRAVVDARSGPMLFDRDLNRLILVTCQPDSLFEFRGPYRLVITAVPDGPAALPKM